MRAHFHKLVCKATSVLQHENLPSFRQLSVASILPQTLSRLMHPANRTRGVKKINTG